MDSLNVFITFIIPTIGRDSLLISIDSLLKLNDLNWNAIIIFDGVKNNFNIKDERIRIIEIDKIGNKGIRNRAGLVRNIGLICDNNSEWIGFLDDDDCISPDYIGNLKEEIKIHKEIDVCIFRMAYNNGHILPQKLDKNIIKGKVGISFAIKREISETNFFINNDFEDYIYLKNLQMKKYKILISSYVSYFIRCEPFNCDFFPKILLNFN